MTGFLTNGYQKTTLCCFLQPACTNIMHHLNGNVEKLRGAFIFEGPFCNFLLTMIFLELARISLIYPCLVAKPKCRIGAISSLLFLSNCLF